MTFERDGKHPRRFVDDDDRVVFVDDIDVARPPAAATSPPAVTA
jgi:ligand-binding SRPBCC domain-containing protein